MNHQLTEIICVIDKSGSMNVLRSEAISGFNYFLSSQQKNTGIAKMTLVFFDDSYEVVYDGTCIDSVKSICNETYVPEGATALLDAIAITIDNVGKRLSETNEEMKPKKVIFAILTDGEENSSQRFSYQQVSDKIRHQKEVYKWDFIFLAANQDAIASASRISISSENAFNFDATGDGIKKAIRCMDYQISDLRKE